jgi:hypothetical protein
MLHEEFAHFGLVVLIWLVQLVIYPSFRWSDPAHFTTWHRSYTRRLSVIVVPLMLWQAFGALVTTIHRASPVNFTLLGLILLIWAVTFAAAVPIHVRLAKRFRRTDVESLIRVNWLRTIGWSAVWLLWWSGSV